MNLFIELTLKALLPLLNALLKGVQDHQLCEAYRRAGYNEKGHIDRSCDEFLWLTLGKPGIVIGEGEHRKPFTVAEIKQALEYNDDLSEYLKDECLLYENQQGTSDNPSYRCIFYNIPRCLKSFRKVFDSGDYDDYMVANLKAWTEWLGKEHKRMLRRIKTLPPRKEK